MRRSCTPRLGEFEFGSDSFVSWENIVAALPIRLLISVEKVLVDTAVLHTGDMAQPAHAFLLEYKAVGYCSAQVHRLVDGFQLVVSEADWWWMLLTHQLRLFEADGKPKVLV